MKCPRCKEIIYSDDKFSMETMGVCSTCSSIEIDVDTLLQKVPYNINNLSHFMYHESEKNIK
jgi:acetyl-CoA carboxylase beta subunit